MFVCIFTYIWTIYVYLYQILSARLKVKLNQHEYLCLLAAQHMYCETRRGCVESAFKIERLSQVPNSFPEFQTLTHMRRPGRAKTAKIAGASTSNLHRKDIFWTPARKYNIQYVFYDLISVLAPMIVRLMAEIDRQADGLWINQGIQTTPCTLSSDSNVASRHWCWEVALAGACILKTRLKLQSKARFGTLLLRLIY